VFSFFAAEQSYDFDLSWWVIESRPLLAATRRSASESRTTLTEADLLPSFTEANPVFEIGYKYLDNDKHVILRSTVVAASSC
jgi:hypothetical protein